MHIFGTTETLLPDHATDNAKSVLIEGELEVEEDMYANCYYQDASQGWTGTFNNADGNTVTCKGGLVTGVA